MTMHNLAGCRDKHVYNYDEVRRWTTEKKLKRMGQASASVLDCDRVIIPVHICWLSNSCQLPG